MKPHWLSRRETIRKLWVAFAVVLVVTVLAERLVEHDPHFAVEAWFGFNAWFGFLACAGLIALAKLLGVFLKRPDRYYEDRDG
jgi:hypothetical protein